MTPMQKHIIACDPVCLNPSFRPKFGKALSAAHRVWCDENPDVTREQRAAAYAETAKRLEKHFPTAAEIAKRG